MISKILENFKNELKEEFYKGIKGRDYQEIFKNPSSKELTGLALKSSKQIRGVLLRNGNLFVVNAYNMIHDNLLLHIKIKNDGNWAYNISDSIKKFICIITDKDNSKIFYLAESYFDNDIEDRRKEFNAYKNIMKKKNPILTLIVKSILEVE